MRRLLAAAIGAAALLAPAGCGSGGGNADDVPTITTRPSATASSTPTAASSASTPRTATSATSTETQPGTETTSAAPPTETGPSPEPPTDEPVGPTTYGQALARVDAGGAPTQSGVRRFATPDDVVYCLLDDPVIGPACELSRGFIKDEDACGGGTADGVGRIETFEDTARPVCNTDTIREPGAPVVTRDGVVVAGAGTQCLVETVGVTCVDTDARTGFFLAPGEYHVF